MKRVLRLNLKREYWEEIKNGSKEFEYRRPRHIGLLAWASGLMTKSICAWAIQTGVTSSAS